MKLNQNLTVLKELGSGASGTVYLCNYHKENFSKQVAVKKFIVHADDKKIYSEAEICSKLIHPNIVQIFNTDKDFDGNLLLIYEYIEGVSLRAYLESKKALSLEESVYIYNSLLNGLEFLQKNKIVHHDFSPRNIILGIHGEVKILDFGLSKKNSYENLTEDSVISGTISYYDPHLIQTHSSYDSNADLYALNLIFYEAVTGNKFFNAYSPNETLSQLKEFQGVTKEDLDLVKDEKLKLFFQKNLSLKRNDRLSIEEINHYLSIFPSKKIDLILSSHIDSKTVSVVNSYRRKNRFNLPVKYLYVPVAFALAITLFLVFNKPSNQEIFYLKQDNVTYKAMVPEELNNSKTYSEISQTFQKKPCEYFYFSFITSIMLLDKKYAESNNVKNVAPDSQAKFVKKLYSFKPIFDAGCARNNTSIISKNIDGLKNKILLNQLLENNEIFLYLKKEFESNSDLINSYEEATQWLSLNYFNVNILLDTDLFKDVRLNAFNLESCTLYSEYSFIYKLLNSKIEANPKIIFNVIGMDPYNKFEIYGQLKDKILFDFPYQQDFKNYKYCFYTYKDGKIKNYFGKLKYVKLDH